MTDDKDAAKELVETLRDGERGYASAAEKVRDGDQEDDGRTKYVIEKGEDRKRIDAAVADILAYEAAMTMPDMSEKEVLLAWR